MYCSYAILSCNPTIIPCQKRIYKIIEVIYIIFFKDQQSHFVSFIFDDTNNFFATCFSVHNVLSFIKWRHYSQG